jgi:hypothetical protein
MVGLVADCGGNASEPPLFSTASFRCERDVAIRAAASSTDEPLHCDGSGWKGRALGAAGFGVMSSCHGSVPSAGSMPRRTYSCSGSVESTPVARCCTRTSVTSLSVLLPMRYTPREDRRPFIVIPSPSFQRRRSWSRLLPDLLPNCSGKIKGKRDRPR